MRGRQTINQIRLLTELGDASGPLVALDRGRKRADSVGGKKRRVALRSIPSLSPSPTLPTSLARWSTGGGSRKGRGTPVERSCRGGGGSISSSSGNR